MLNHKSYPISYLDKSEVCKLINCVDKGLVEFTLYKISIDKDYGYERIKYLKTLYNSDKYIGDKYFITEDGAMRYLRYINHIKPSLAKHLKVYKVRKTELPKCG